MTANPTINTGGTVAAVSIAIGSFIHFLPDVASGLSVVWFATLLYDRFVNRKGPKNDE